MPLYTATASLFGQLQQLLEKLTPTEYSAPSEALSGSTIGQHLRHIIELFVELNQGYTSGVVCYEKRQRDYRIQTDTAFAADCLHHLLAAMEKPDKALLLQTDLTTDTGAFTLSSSYHRELLFNIEHTVHHMALIRIGVRELTSLALPAEFGVAASTLKHQQLCAQ